jgi:hypothetical protein
MEASDFLCDRCSLLRLSASHSDCHEAVDEDGLPILEYDSGRIEIDFQLSDIFPDFPRLQASAAAGCGFCPLLISGLKERVDNIEFLSPREKNGRAVVITSAAFITSNDLSLPSRRPYPNRLLFLHVAFQISGLEDFLQFDVIADPGPFKHP